MQSGGGRLFHALQLWVKSTRTSWAMHLHINIYLLPQWGGINLLMKQSMLSFTPVAFFRHITGPAKSHTPMNIYKLKLQPNCMDLYFWEYDLEYRLLRFNGTANGESIESETLYFQQWWRALEVSLVMKGLEIFVLASENPPMNQW